MKNLVKILCLVLLIVTFSACTKKPANTNLLQEIKNRETFNVGISENSKPFGYINDKNGNYEGFDVDLIGLISGKIFGKKKQIKFVPVTPANRIYKLNSKEVDVVISTMTINKERLMVVDFSTPYFMTGQALLVKKNGKIRSGKDLNGKILGIVLGTTAANNIKLIASNTKIRGFKTYKDAFTELKRGNIDAISTDDVILQGIVSENPNYTILNERYSTEFYGIAFRKDEASQSLKTAVNNVLREFEKSGQLKKLEIKYNVFYRR